MSDVYIEEDKNILEAMRQIDKSGKKILFVHKDHRLRASLTDGDIRRLILRKGNLQLTVKDAANYHPKYLYENESDLAIHIIKEQRIDAVPIVDKEHVIKKIVFADNSLLEFDMFEREIPIVIMAGGLGTRLSPYTNILPKPLIPVGDYPIVEHIINRFSTYGCRQFYMIVNYKDRKSVV